MSRYQLFLQAKQAIRTHPGMPDSEIASLLQVHPQDSDSLRVIAEARKDVLAGDTARPHTST